MENVCNDYGDNPACLKVADERFTMDYRDVEGGGFIYWCAHCGPVAQGMEKAIQGAFAERPGFAEEFRAAMDKVEEESPKH